MKDYFRLMIDVMITLLEREFSPSDRFVVTPSHKGKTPLSRSTIADLIDSATTTKAFLEAVAQFDAEIAESIVDLVHDHYFDNWYNSDIHTQEGE